MLEAAPSAFTPVNVINGVLFARGIDGEVV